MKGFATEVTENTEDQIEAPSCSVLSVTSVAVPKSLVKI
jgi:hypothetical protein